MDFFEKTVSRRDIFSGRIVTLHVDQVELPDGSPAEREVVEHPGGVCIAAVDGEGFVTLVRQFRYPFSREVLELPAGKLEPGEDPTLCAGRELGEETGFKAGRLIPLGNSLASPGFCTEVVRLYLALDLTPGESHPDEGEFLRVVKLPFREAVEMALDGRIEDAKTVAALLRADWKMKNL